MYYTYSIQSIRTKLQIMIRNCGRRWPTTWPNGIDQMGSLGMRAMVTEGRRCSLQVKCIIIRLSELRCNGLEMWWL